MADQEKAAGEKKTNGNKDVGLTCHVPAALLAKLNATVAVRQKQRPFAKVNKSDVIREALALGLEQMVKKEKVEG